MYPKKYGHLLRTEADLAQIVLPRSGTTSTLRPRVNQPEPPEPEVLAPAPDARQLQEDPRRALPPHPDLQVSLLDLNRIMGQMG